jgi:hypothetical protein
MDMMKKPVNGATTNGAILLKKNTMKQLLLMVEMMLVMTRLWKKMQEMIKYFKSLLKGMGKRI